LRIAILFKRERHYHRRVPFPAVHPTIPALLRSAAADHGDVPYVIADGRTVTYAETERRSAARAITSGS
jgi:hypothetical protein